MIAPAAPAALEPSRSDDIEGESAATKLPMLSELLAFSAGPDHQTCTDTSDFELVGDVTKIHQSYEWPVHYVLKASKDTWLPIAEKFGCTSEYGVLSKLCKVVASERMSTAFTGIDAPGLAANLLGRALECVMRDVHGDATATRPVLMHTHATEWDTECQAEILSSHMHKPFCCFRNIREFYPDSIQAWTKNIETRAKNGTSVRGVYNALLPSIQSGHGCKSAAYCIVHKGVCDLSRSGPPADFHIAGTPCTDESPMKIHKQGALDGRTALYFLVWIALRLREQEKIIIQENVPEFPTTYLQMLLGHLYDVQEITLQAADFGFPSLRRRKFTIMSHKYKVGALLFPVNQLTILMERKARISWREYFTADCEDLYEELGWAMNKAYQAKDREERSHECPDGAHKSKLKGDELTKAIREFALASYDIGEAFLFERLLTNWEVNVLKAYRMTYPGDACSLSQNPEGGRTVRSSGDNLHCVVKRCGLIWGDIANSHGRPVGRWLLGKELLSSQGFPTMPWHWGHEDCSFSRPRRTERNRAAMMAQSGNTMNLAVVGAILLYKWLAVPQRPADRIVLDSDGDDDDADAADALPLAEVESDEASASNAASSSEGESESVPAVRNRFASALQIIDGVLEIEEID